MDHKKIASADALSPSEAKTRRQCRVKSRAKQVKQGIATQRQINKGKAKDNATQDQANQWKRLLKPSHSSDSASTSLSFNFCGKNEIRRGNKPTAGTFRKPLLKACPLVVKQH
ncbi:MAG: hypothetical protein IPL73_19785 [Candidatus Obscuribacter sp.]|nr:hypothetical protein [Candidatus Obscuribacter sp.]